MIDQMSLNFSQFRAEHEILMFVGKQQGFCNLLL